MTNIKNYKPSTKIFGHPLIHFESVESTQKSMRDQYLKIPKQGLIIVADNQTMGRGQQTKTWVSLPGEHIFMSLLFQSTLKEQDLPYLNLMVAQALKQTLEEFNLKKIRIKWPNDILVENKKISGILSERTFVKGDPWIILGIGINLNEPLDHISNIDQPYTSVSKCLNQFVDRINFLDQFLNHFESLFQKTEKDVSWLYSFKK